MALLVAYEALVPRPFGPSPPSVGGIVWTFSGKKQKQLRQGVDRSDHSPVNTAQTQNERACHTGRDRNENHPAEKSSGVLQHCILNEPAISIKASVVSNKYLDK